MRTSAFPLPAQPAHVGHSGGLIPGESAQSCMDLLDYFAAHAPAEPQPWFSPVMATERPEPVFDGPPPATSPVNIEALRAYDRARERERYLQWPYAWAVEQVSRRVRQMR